MGTEKNVIMPPRPSFKEWTERRDTTNSRGYNNSASLFDENRPFDTWEKFFERFKKYLLRKKSLMIFFKIFVYKVNLNFWVHFFDFYI